MNISDKILNLAEKVEFELTDLYREIDARAERNLLKVIEAMQKNKVSYDFMNGSTGYGYDDAGRDALEAVYADIFKTETALVRPQIACGTHAIATALFGVLRPGDELLSPVGKPYDTLESVIGIRETKGSLVDFGVVYRQADLLPDGSFDYEKIGSLINDKTRMVTIQRSRGYADRPSFTVKQIGELISFIKSKKKDVVCFVDNCYGEFVEDNEPTEVGADLMAGSLIKNPGGGLAPLGGYIVGSKELIELCAVRLTCPGLGREVGATVSVMRSFYQGLFLSPTVVAGALKGAIFASKIFENMGFSCNPKSDDKRTDIIQSVKLLKGEYLEAFCEGIQMAAPVDAHVKPIPSDMPGYDSKVIMAAGAFISGSSMELSADGPMREPFNVFFQGGLSYAHCKLGIMMAAEKVISAKSL